MNPFNRLSFHPSKITCPLSISAVSREACPPFFSFSKFIWGHAAKDCNRFMVFFSPCLLQHPQKCSGKACDPVKDLLFPNSIRLVKEDRAIVIPANRNFERIHSDVVFLLCLGGAVNCTLAGRSLHILEIKVFKFFPLLFFCHILSGFHFSEIS